MNWPTLNGVPVALGQELTAAEARVVRAAQPFAWLSWWSPGERAWCRPTRARYFDMSNDPWRYRFHGMGDAPRDLDDLPSCIQVGDVVSWSTAAALGEPGRCDWSRWNPLAQEWELRREPPGPYSVPWRYRYDGPAKPAKPAKPAVSEEVTREVAAWVRQAPLDADLGPNPDDVAHGLAEMIEGGICPALPAISPRLDPTVPQRRELDEEVTREVVAWLEGRLWLPEDTPTRAGWNDALRAAARDARRGDCPVLPAITPKRDPVTNLTADELREACRRMGLEVSS